MWDSSQNHHKAELEPQKIKPLGNLPHRHPDIAPNAKVDTSTRHLPGKTWRSEADLNCRHADFQGHLIDKLSLVENRCKSLSRHSS